MQRLVSVLLAACVTVSGQVANHWNEQLLPEEPYGAPSQNARTALPELDDRFIRVERCGNSSFCLSSYDHQTFVINEATKFCKGYVELETVQSPICLNAVVHCENNLITGGCYFGVSAAEADRVACDVVYTRCDRHTPASPHSPTSTEPTTRLPTVEEDRFVTLERCGNRSICLSSDDYIRERYENGDELCKGYVERETIQSPTCLNALVNCENHKHVGGCFNGVLKSRIDQMACDFAYSQCEVYTPSSKVATSTEPFTAPPPPAVEGRFVRLERCDNQTICLSRDDFDTSDAVCKGYDVPMVIQSPTCLNGAVECVNSAIRDVSFLTVRIEEADRFPCEAARQSLYANWVASTTIYTEPPTTSSPRTTTSSVPRTSTTAHSTIYTEPPTTSSARTTTSSVPRTSTTVLSTTTTSATPAVGDSCKRTSRVPTAGDCSTYLECSNGHFAERKCYTGYVFYESFGFCLPGDTTTCNLLQM
uniref:Chitin-binding type-2 domain-containing protein n=1 Tax=Anopheles dirus TaxID=7168 RepID=A0A182NVR9_9DIPT